MSTDRYQSYRERAQRVRDQVPIAGVIGASVALGRNNRAQCPFHKGKSQSFAVYSDKGTARCWGCGWPESGMGDVIRFVMDFWSLSFVEALERLEGQHGLDPQAAAPIARARAPVRRRARAYVDSAVVAAWMIERARPDLDAVRTYLRARGIGEAWLTRERLTDLRFIAQAPTGSWPEDGGPRDMPSAPAIVAQVRRPGDWAPMGVHVTYLRPDLAGKMERQRADGSAMEARKMYGAVLGGGVLLGRYESTVPLFAGEGVETVLSGLGVLGADPERSIGLAALSLLNLEGKARRLKNGALPLYDPVPEESAALSFAHGAPVTVLIDADMKPLFGPVDRLTGLRRGVPVVERRGADMVRRPISAAERSWLCAELALAAWRRAGCRATAFRPRMGMDFNNAGRAA